MKRLLLLTLLGAACSGGDETPPPKPGPAPATSQTTEAPVTSVRSEAFSTGGWTVENIDQLVPVVPARTASTPALLKGSPELEQTLATLREVVQRHGGDPSNAWAIGHAMVGLGTELELQNGKQALPWLFETYAEEFQAGDKTLIRFPKAQGEVRVEPHTDLMLKMLTEAGVSPNTAVTVQGKPHTVADLYRGAVIQSVLDPQRNHSNYAGTNDMAWSLQGISAWAPKDLRWTAVDGTAMALDDLTTFNVSVLVAESKPLFEAMQAQADFEKKGQGIFGYTCGGAHLLQGTAFSVFRGFGPELGPKFMGEQAQLMFFRLPRELQIYDRLMTEHPQHQVRLLAQRLKFTGHFLESMHKLAAMGAYTPTPQQTQLLEGAAQQVVLTTRALDEQAAFDGMDALHASDEQLYLDLIGDSAHAINGLELALGRRQVRY